VTKSEQKKLVGAIISLLVIVLGAWQASQQPTVPITSASTDNRDSAVAPLVVPEGFVALNRVVDGDTIEVAVGSEKHKVRIIGINSPESVDPRKAVECFGLEASAHMKELLNAPYVRLETDSSQAGEDKYGRWLRYAYSQAGLDVGLQMIKDGYAHEYTYDAPYTYQTVYRTAQREAQTARRGLWSADTCNGKP
jgi:micrococcal nuclease